MALTKIKKALGVGVEEKALTLTDPDALTLFGSRSQNHGLDPFASKTVKAIAATEELS